jgi:hypothetical protein
MPSTAHAAHVMQQTTDTTQRATCNVHCAACNGRKAACSTQPLLVAQGTPMTFKEKRELSCNMNKLSSKKLGRVVQVALLSAARLPFCFQLPLPTSCRRLGDAGCNDRAEGIARHTQAAPSCKIESHAAAQISPAHGGRHIAPLATRRRLSTRTIRCS